MNSDNKIQVQNIPRLLASFDVFNYWFTKKIIIYTQLTNLIIQ